MPKRLPLRQRRPGTSSPFSATVERNARRRLRVGAAVLKHACFVLVHLGQPRAITGPPHCSHTNVSGTTNLGNQVRVGTFQSGQVVIRVSRHPTAHTSSGQAMYTGGSTHTRLGEVHHDRCLWIDFSATGANALQNVMPNLKIPSEWQLQSKLNRTAAITSSTALHADSASTFFNASMASCSAIASVVAKSGGPCRSMPSSLGPWQTVLKPVN